MRQSSLPISSNSDQFKYIILTILYKCKPANSPTVQSLIQNAHILNNSKVIFWDNSPLPISTEEYMSLEKQFVHFQYKNTPENLSLSKIYNEVINEGRSADFFIIFDQDSSFKKSYFEILKSAINTNRDINLFLPYVLHNDKVVSPGDYKLIKGKYWKTKMLGRILAKNKAAISSGMCISFNYLNNSFSGYDERLTLYGIDTFFMLEYAKHNSYFYVLDYELKHSLSIFENESTEAVLKRFRNKKKCFAILHEKPLPKFLLVKLYIYYLSAKMAILYNDVRFLS